MRTVAIIQARLGSTRLPRKVLLPLAGRPVIEHVIERTCRAGQLDEVVVAIPSLDRELSEPVLTSESADRPIRIYYGDEDDVLGRFYDAACCYGAGTIVRVTADCPLIDPEIVDACIKRFRWGGADYLSVSHPERTMAKGLDVEIFSLDALREAHFRTLHPTLMLPHYGFREHVTSYFYGTRHDTKLGGFRCRTFTPEGGPWVPDVNLSIDTKDDYERVKAIFERCYEKNPKFGWKDVKELV